MQWISITADILAWVTAIISAVFAIRAWQQATAIRQTMEQEKQRQNKKIQIILQYGGKEYKLPVTLRRADLTRSEILGYLGMIPMKKKGERYSLAYLNYPEFARRINEISDTDGDSVLTISCTQDEIAQFDFSSAH
jgi:hypothetical protein